MTDYLEPYRQLVRSIRFAPQVGQHERFNRLVHQPLPVPSVHHSETRQVNQTSTTTSDAGPSPDPSEHSAALVHAAVSKHTVLPVTYSISENIADRISRLTTSKPKQVRLPIVTPKIPEPDPNWIPPTPPPANQHLVTDSHLHLLVETKPVSPTVEDESPVRQPEAIADLTPVSTHVAESENVTEQATEIADLASTSPDEVETENIAEESIQAENSSPEIAAENISEQANGVADLNQEEAPTEKLSLPSNEVSEPVRPATPEVENEVTQVAEIKEDTGEIKTEENQIESTPSSADESVAIANGKTPIAQPETSDVEVAKIEGETAKSTESPNITVACPECNSRDVRKNGKQKNKQKYLCKDCGRQFVWSASIREDIKSNVVSSEEAKPTSDSLTSKAKTAKSKAKNQPKGFGANKKK